MTRGNQREKDRERAAARNAKGKTKDDGLTPEQRRESVGSVDMIMVLGCIGNIFVLKEWIRSGFRANEVVRFILPLIILYSKPALPPSIQASASGVNVPRHYIRRNASASTSRTLYDESDEDLVDEDDTVDFGNDGEIRNGNLDDYSE
ncbi:small EDRK-rich factor 2-like protein [Tanacetum coccineum]